MSVSEDSRFGQRRREILTAAEKVFDAHGYAAATVDAVAVEAGISKGSLYNYFQNKADLFAQLFSEVVASGEAKTRRILNEPIRAVEKLSRILDDWFERLGYYKRIGRLVLEFWVTAARQEQEGRLGNWFEQAYTGWRGMFAKIIDQGVEEGDFRIQFDSQVAAALIVAVIDGITVQAILDMGLHVDEKFLAALKRAIILGLTAGAGATGAEGQVSCHEQ